MGKFIDRLKQMPETLAALCGMFFLFGPVLVCLAIFPVGGWRNEDGPLTYSELWKSGAGPLVTLIGIGMVVVARAFYRALGWVKTAIPVIFLTGAAAVLALAWLDRFSVAWHDSIGPAVWSAISWWYLNRKHNVVEYFATR